MVLRDNALFVAFKHERIVAPDLIRDLDDLAADFDNFGAYFDPVGVIAGATTDYAWSS